MATEEGLASLNTVVLHPHCKLLIGPALRYYSAAMAQQMSFQQLFHHLQRFVADSEVRWHSVMRVKRGMQDTSSPGCFCKDQAYLQGAVEVLQQRDKIDRE